MSGLNQGSATMSLKTAQMQKRLFWALTIQTIIPICVSFMPVTLVLYGSAFCIDFPKWDQNLFLRISGVAEIADFYKFWQFF